MDDPRANDLDTAISEVMAAMRAHRAWLLRWHRHAVCRTAPDPDMVAEDSHLSCRFGQWLPVFTFADPKVLDGIDQLHRLLHAHARSISKLIERGAAPEPSAYDELGSVAESFVRLVLGLERNLREQVNQRDPLTGADSRRAMQLRLEREYELAVEARTSAYIAMIDVDHFKLVNDTSGHAAGDEVLRAVARCMREVIRPRDSVFRYGGDEFLICLTEIEEDAAVSVLERLRRLVASLEVAGQSVTLSVGIARLDTELPLEASLARADRALYLSKRDGRNRTRVDDTSDRGVVP